MSLVRRFNLNGPARLAIILALTVFACGLGLALTWRTPNPPAITRGAEQPISISNLGEAAIQRTSARLGFALQDGGFEWGAPLFLRVVKSTGKLDVFMLRGQTMALHRRYSLCGETDLSPGPRTEAAPERLSEGIYAIRPQDFKHRDGTYLGIPYGWPQAHDISLGWSRNNKPPLLDGRCTGAGSIGLTDQDMEEVYTLIWASLRAGQASVPVHIYPQALGWADRLPEETDGRTLKLWAQLSDIWRAGASNGVPPAITASADGYVLTKP